MLEENDADLLPPDQPDTQDEVDITLINAAADFDTSMRSKFSTTQYKALRTIGAFIMRGLSLRECCILARVPFDNLQAVMDANEDVREFVMFKQTAYKASLLSVVTGSAVAQRQPKMAGYLLENQYRDDFGKKPKDTERPKDALENALEHIRTSGDSESLVKRLPPPEMSPDSVIDARFPVLSPLA